MFTKDEDRWFYEANSVVAKFEGDAKYEFANKEWWTYKVKNEDGEYDDKNPNEVGVTYIWIPNRQALLDYVNARVGESIDWTILNNCKSFTNELLMKGFEGVTDENHLEIRDLLSDENAHPRAWYNEFGENKTIKNPEKNDNE